MTKLYKQIENTKQRTQKMKHKMTLNEAPFLKIKNGIKTIELRLYDEKRRGIQKGDVIEFKNAVSAEEAMLCEVVEMHVFDSFDSLYKNLPLLKCGYTEADIDTADPTDMDEYYSRKKQTEYGVVGIELKLL